MDKDFSNREKIMSNTASILDMLRTEVPLQVEMFALLKASTKTESDRREDIKKAIAHFEKKDSPSEHDKKTIKQLKNELTTLEKSTYRTAKEDSENSFSREELRRRLHVIFGAYLAFLEQHDAEGFAEAMNIIEKDIKDSRKTLARMKRSLGKSSNETVSTGEKALAVRAHEYFAPVDKVTRSVFDRRKNSAFYENPEIRVKVGTKGGKPVLSIISINISELKNVTISNDVMLNPYNRAIHNIAVSLYNAGNTHITPSLIYHTINGGRREKEVPEQVRQDIMDSMRKLMLTFIKIDATEEAKAFGFDKLTFEGYLMPVKLVTALINGQEVESFKFLDEPPLYTYASKKKQISRCDIGLLAADISMTPENIVIRDYLLEQILTMQNTHNKRNNVILYDTLYEYLGVEAPNNNALKQKRLGIREKVKTILNAWVKAKFITGYDELLEGRKIKGLYIKYAKQRK